MLSIYTSHDRELLFHDTIEAARAQGMLARLRDHSEVLVDGRWRKVVNRHVESNYIGLWVAS